MRPGGAHGGPDQLCTLQQRPDGCGRNSVCWIWASGSGRFITHYREAFFLPDRRSAQQVFTWKPKPGAEDEIYRRISDITISMKSADYLRMPEYISNRVPVKLSREERRTYEQLKHELVISLRGAQIDAVSAASLSGKLCQLANGGIYDAEHNSLFFHERKLDALEDLIEGANGRPVLVAYWFKHDLQRIQERFHVREIRTSRDIADWNSGKIPVACIHPASAGHGLNLQAGGNTLIWFGLTWSLELYQPDERPPVAARDQADTVVIHHIIAETPSTNRSWTLWALFGHDLDGADERRESTAGGVETMNAKEYLGQAYRLDQHINDRLMQLSQLRALTQRITTAYDGEVVSRTRNVHALEDSVIRLMEAEESINEEIDRFVDIKMDISKTIARVRNENYRLILEKRYLCFMTWEQISLDMHYTNRWLRKMHERALDVVDRILLERSGSK